MGRRTDGSRPWEAPRHAGRWGLVLLVVLGCSLSDYACVWAAAAPERGGTIVWAVHESMPSFDPHYETSYIVAQPIGPLYNGLLTFDVYDNEQIVGDLAERWEITDGGKRIMFALRQGVKFHDGADFTCADAKYSLEKRAERNPHYWKPGLPYIDAYQAVVIADLTKVFASFRGHQLTMTGIGRYLERPDADILYKDVPDTVIAIGGAPRPHVRAWGAVSAR